MPKRLKSDALADAPRPPRAKNVEMSDEPRRTELERLLDDLSYEITTARSCGLGDDERLRVVARRIRDIAADLDAFAGSIVAERQAAQG